MFETYENENDAVRSFCCIGQGLARPAFSRRTAALLDGAHHFFILRGVTRYFGQRSIGSPIGLQLLTSLRPRQWTKNLLVFAGLLFGRRLDDPRAIVAALAAFAVFCLLSGVVYIVNDISDRDSDRRHPLKAPAADRRRERCR